LLSVTRESTATLHAPDGSGVTSNDVAGSSGPAGDASDSNSFKVCWVGGSVAAEVYDIEVEWSSTTPLDLGSARTSR
jgi:hypothetical protein